MTDLTPLFDVAVLGEGVFLLVLYPDVTATLKKKPMSCKAYCYITGIFAPKAQALIG
jgi:hypothetical protein